MSFPKSTFWDFFSSKLHKTENETMSFPKSIFWDFFSSKLILFVLLILLLIVICIKKQTKLWVGHFMTLSGHFLANYINIFYKIELLTIILMCLTCLNLLWIKSYLIKKHFCHLLFLKFCKKNTENLCFINSHFRTISGHNLATTWNSFTKNMSQQSF